MLDPPSPDPLSTGASTLDRSAVEDATVRRSDLGAITGPAFSDPTPSGGTQMSSTGRAVFDQDAAPSTNRGALIAAVIVVVAILTVAGIFITASRSDSDTTSPSLPAITTEAVPGNDPTDGSATTAVAPVTLPPATLPPATTAPSTTAPATTAPSTTAPATTAPATTAPATTAPATTAAPPTTAPPLWAIPAVPPPPLPTSGPGRPLIASEAFPGGVRAVDAQPFFLRVQALADALAAGNYGEARTIQLESLGDDSVYAARYGQLDRSSLILLDAGVAGGSYELLTIEMNLEESAAFTRVLCTQFVADGAQGRVTRRGGFELERWPENITPEQLRNNSALFDGLRTRCTFGSVRPSLES